MPRTIEEHVFGWILLALRQTIGIEDIRNLILRNEFFEEKDLKFGKTFGLGFTKKKILEYLEKIIRKPRNINYLTFTSINETINDSLETHYQAFILDYKNKILWVIDPAINPISGQGIYDSDISINTINPFFIKNHWTIQYAPVSCACQLDERDVFCQTWSLYLQIELLKKLKTQPIQQIEPINIPRNNRQKYQLFVDFLKKIIEISEFCQEFENQYISIINEHPDLVGDVSAKQKSKIRKFYLDLHICDIIKQINYQDIL